MLQLRRYCCMKVCLRCYKLNNTRSASAEIVLQNTVHLASHRYAGSLSKTMLQCSKLRPADIRTMGTRPWNKTEQIKNPADALMGYWIERNFHTLWQTPHGHCREHMSQTMQLHTRSTWSVNNTNKPTHQCGIRKECNRGVKYMINCLRGSNGYFHPPVSMMRLFTTLSGHNCCLGKNLHMSVRGLYKTAYLLGSSWPPSDPYANPAQELAPLLQIPLFKPEEEIFTPSGPDLHLAEELFGRKMAQDLTIRKGVVDLKNLPETTVPEVAFLGRSNVGKSSLIKSIFNNLPETRVSVSKKPGHTKVLKFYQVGRRFTLVDMPGYGANMPTYFQQSVEGYLKTRETLSRVFFLVDGAEGMSDEDLIAVEMMEEFSKPYVIIMTKIDMKSPHEILRNLLAVQKFKRDKMNCCFPQPFLVSSVTRGGIGLLQAFIAYVTGNLDVKGL